MTWLAIITLLVSLIGGGGAALASGNALPGEALYPVKAALEATQLTLAGDASDAELLAEFALERAQEIEGLVAQGDYEDIPEAVLAYIEIAKGLSEKLYEISQQNWEGQEIELTQEVLVISNQTLSG